MRHTWKVDGDRKTHPGAQGIVGVGHAGLHFEGAGGGIDRIVDGGDSPLMALGGVGDGGEGNGCTGRDLATETFWQEKGDGEGGLILD